MGRTSDQFKCASCNRLRDRRTEMSRFSKDLCRSKAAAKMHSKDVSALLYCRYCHLDLKNLSPAAAKAMEKRAYWESKVTPEEAGENRKPGPVTTKKVEEPAAENVKRTKGYSPSGRNVPQKYRNEVARKVRMARRLKDQTQKESAKEAGVSPGTIGNIERAESFVTRTGLEIAETWADIVLLEWREATKEPEAKKEVVIRHPKGSKADPPAASNGAPAPWEVDAIKDEIAALKAQITGFMEWMEKYEQQAPGWHGWAELRESLGKVG